VRTLVMIMGELRGAGDRLWDCRGHFVVRRFDLGRGSARIDSA